LDARQTSGVARSCCGHVGQICVHQSPTHDTSFESIAFGCFRDHLYVSLWSSIGTSKYAIVSTNSYYIYASLKKYKTNFVSFLTHFLTNKHTSFYFAATGLKMCRSWKRVTFRYIYLTILFDWSPSMSFSFAMLVKSSSWSAEPGRVVQIVYSTFLNPEMQDSLLGLVVGNAFKYTLGLDSLQCEWIME